MAINTNTLAKLLPIMKIEEEVRKWETLSTSFKSTSKMNRVTKPTKERFKMKRKPKPPRRQKKCDLYESRYGESLKTLVQRFPVSEWDKIIVQNHVSFIHEHYETKEELKERKRDYEVKLAEYNQWLEENKETIRAEKEARAKAKFTRNAQALNQRKEALEKKLKGIQDNLTKELEALKKQGVTL